MFYASLNPRLKGLVVTLAVLVIFAYGATFASFVLKYFQPDLTFLPVTEVKPGLDHVWTSVSVLVGSVVAVALGQPEAKGALIGWTGWFERHLVIIYAWVWLAVGVAACAVWFFASSGDDFPLLIKNAATTFLGLVIPVVAQFFGDHGASGSAVRESIDHPRD